MLLIDDLAADSVGVWLIAHYKGLFCNHYQVSKTPQRHIATLPKRHIAKRKEEMVLSKDNINTAIFCYSALEQIFFQT